MALENYRDLSQAGSDLGAGFQFEFFCSKCNRKWKSPFKPYRMGQIAGLISRFSFLIKGSQTASRTTGNFADMGSRGAKESALAEAMEQANKLYTVCESCKGAVCDDCWSPRDNSCTPCAQAEQREAEKSSGRSAREAEHGGALACPNCRTPSGGGRFCAECGFDMASTHKSCPGCGTMVLRQARFCTDCGHSF
jgi:Double zinc ribbon